MVDLETVSIFSQTALKDICSNDEEYKKTPFLYLISSLVRNKAIEWADNNFKYISKKQTGAWMVYCFEYI